MDPEIVIIGAGAAGIGAAKRLAAAGIKPVLLEALPRPGGRAFTAHAAGMPLDLGCGYLHSADRNPWTIIAETSGIAIERASPAWDQQYKNLGAPVEEWEAASEAFDKWGDRLITDPPASDIAADAMEPDGRYNAFLQAMSGFISGDELERISVTDYAAYDQASSYCNWRLPHGYGTLVTSNLPPNADLRLNTKVEKIGLEDKTLTIETSAGTLRPRAAILTISTNILAGNSIAWPSAIDPWREAAANLPLGNDEKLFFEITGDSPFEGETHVLGDLYNPATGSYYIRPFGRPVIECFLGGAGARAVAQFGADAAFARAMDQLVALFGSGVRSCLRPLIISDWTNTASINGAYSHALPGHSQARITLAQPYDNRLFFAGEATHRTDFSTAHGAYMSGLRAAEEAILALQRPYI